MINDTNPDHYKVEGANFIEYMNDPKISGFGNWMFANGFNSGVWASTNWISVKDRLPEPGMSVIIYGTPKEDPEHTDGKIAITYMSEWNFLDSRIKTEPYWIMPWQYFSFDYTITHWMPLPEPPEGVN